MKYTYVLTRTFLDGLSNNLAKVTVTALPTSHLLVIRTLIIFVLSLTGFKSLKADAHIIKGNRKLQIHIFISCLISTIASVLFYKGLVLLPVSIVSVVNNTFHIVAATVIGVLFFKQKHNIKFFLLLVALIPATGLVLAPALNMNLDLSWAGLGYLAASAILYSLSCHTTGLEVKELRIQTVAMLRTLASLVCLIVIALFVRDPISITLEALTIVIFSFIAFAALSNFIMRLLHLKSLKEIGATASTVFSSLSPIFTIVLAIFMFDESLNLVQWSGVLSTIVILYFIAKN